MKSGFFLLALSVHAIAADSPNPVQVEVRELPEATSKSTKLQDSRL